MRSLKKELFDTISPITIPCKNKYIEVKMLSNSVFTSINYRLIDKIAQNEFEIIRSREAAEEYYVY